MKFRYDIIVVGGGHAGCEAAHIAAVMGANTLLVTMDMTKLAQMSCNPAMGGIAKGQIVREIDALGGMSGIVTDRSMIQFRMLNRSKGPAMWSPRAQCDRMLFSREWRKILENTGNLSIWQEQATGLIIEDGSVKGVTTAFGTEFRADAVILTNGTFLNGLMHVGFNITSIVGLHGQAGQANYAASKAGLVGLTKSVAKELGSRSITCNALAPGFIETDMTHGLSDEMRQNVIKAAPLGRLGQPGDIASVVKFFASDAASYITGQVLEVDGGLSL